MRSSQIFQMLTSPTCHMIQPKEKQRRIHQNVVFLKKKEKGGVLLQVGCYIIMCFLTFLKVLLRYGHYLYIQMWEPRICPKSKQQLCDKWQDFSSPFFHCTVSFLCTTPFLQRRVCGIHNCLLQEHFLFQCRETGAY